MNFLAANRAVFESSLPGLERLVLLVLVDHMPNVTPSVSRIATRSGLADRTVRRALIELETRGVIRVERANGRRSAYQLDLERLTTNQGLIDRGQRDLGTVDRGQSDRTPRSQRPRTPVTETAKGSNQGTKEGSNGVASSEAPPTSLSSAIPWTAPTAERSALTLVADQGHSPALRALKSKRPRSPGRTARGTPLPPEWAPSDTHIAFARENHLDVTLELTKFRGHADGKGRLMKSWNGAFTTWLANAVTYAAERGRGGSRAPRVQMGIAPGVKFGSSADFD